MLTPESADRKASPVFLATTAIESCWDTSGRIVFLGEGCRRYRRRAAWSGLDAETLADLWDDPVRRAEAYRRVNFLYVRTLPLLGARLNEIHGESHGERYWHLVIGFWLFHYLTVLFDRYCHLVSALERFPVLSTVLLEEDCDVIPSGTHDFMEWVRTDTYNLQLCSRLLQSLGKNDFPRIALRQEFEKPIPWGRQWSGLASLVRPYARRTLSGLLARAGQGRVILHQSYFPRELELGLAARSKGVVLPSFVLDDLPAGRRPNPALRAKLAGLTRPENGFEKALAELLPRDIPYCFVENYQDIARGAQRFPAGPRAIFSANSWIYHETFKQWAGRCSEEGTLLLVSQHGGGYFGLGTYFPQEDHELRIADHYYTWGWRPSRPDQHKVVSMPATMLAGRKSMPADNRKNGILYVATAESRYLQSLQDTVGRFTRYLEWQGRFLGSFPMSIKGLVRGRLFLEDMGWDIRERWHDHSPEVRIEDVSRPFLESMEDCRLFVSDHLGTTIVEAMAANRPSLVFFDLESNPPRSESRSVFDELQGTGILHATPESAAQAAAAAYPDVEAWWNDPHRQSVRRSFCERHARTSADPVGDWSDEFRSVSRQAMRQ